MAQRRTSLATGGGSAASGRLGSVTPQRRGGALASGRSKADSMGAGNVVAGVDKPSADSYETPYSKTGVIRGSNLSVYSTDQTAGLRGSNGRNLVESPGMMNSVNQKRVAWESYIQYLDQIQFRGIRNAVVNTMAHLLHEIGID